MAKPFTVSITNPEKVIYEGTVVSLVAPCALGYLGVLADHAPLFAKLAAGTITVREESGKALRFSSHSSGFLEMLQNNATLILQQAESVSGV